MKHPCRRGPDRTPCKDTVNCRICNLYEHDVRYKSLLSEPTPQKVAGLGDFVASVAQPIAGAIDKIFGTNVKNCGGCKGRQEVLNKLTQK